MSALARHASREPADERESRRTRAFGKLGFAKKHRNVVDQPRSLSLTRHEKTSEKALKRIFKWNQSSETRRTS